MARPWVRHQEKGNQLGPSQGSRSSPGDGSRGHLACHSSTAKHLSLSPRHSWNQPCATADRIPCIASQWRLGEKHMRKSSIRHPTPTANRTLPVHQKGRMWDAGRYGLGQTSCRGAITCPQSRRICWRWRKFQKWETYRRGWLLWIRDGRAKPLMDCKVLDLSHSFSLSFSDYLPTYLSIFYVSIYLSLSLFDLIILSIYLSIYPSIHLSIYPSIHLSIYPSLHLSISLSLYLSICLSVYLSICLSVCLSVYLSICLPVYLWCSVIQCHVV